MSGNTAPDWRADDGRGELRAAVEGFLGDAEMTHKDIALVRIFLRRALEHGALGAISATMADVLRTQVNEITTRADIERWLDRAGAEGFDPL